VNKPGADTYDQRKSDAYKFLKSFEEALTAKLPPPQELRTSIRKIMTAAKTGMEQEHLRLPESAFLNLFAIPTLYQSMQEQDGMDASMAAQSLLSEYKRMRLLKKTSGSPIRTLKHPFTKVMAAKPTAIMKQWISGLPTALTQSCPDFSTREPFPYKILFEGKYFEKGGPEKATTELVNSIYQAFFYRGLPYVPSRNKSPAWDYEFACLLAADVSDGATLKRSWENLPSVVKNGFWDGANIYVMIVRGAV
jgi:hypothetical protein